MNPRLPPLNALRAFETAARHLSFRRAAEELFVTPAAISHQIKGLEDYLGVMLFHRLNKSLLLTEAGQAALPALRDGFERLAEAVEILRADSPSRLLTVSVAPSFASKWLVPRLERFRQSVPGIDIRIDATSRCVDFIRDRVDVGIRYGAGDYPGLHSDCLRDDEVMPVCSPALLAGEYPLQQPDDLRHHTLLHIDDPVIASGWPRIALQPGQHGHPGRRGGPRSGTGGHGAGGGRSGRRATGQAFLPAHPGEVLLLPGVSAGSGGASDSGGISRLVASRDRRQIPHPAAGDRRLKPRAGLHSGKFHCRSQPVPPVLSSIVFCIRHEQILLLQRRKPPFVGYWTGPGGKLEAGEAPYQCAIRELREETGLVAHSPQLRGVITETSPREDFQWLLFIYVVRTFEGQVLSDEREGRLRWWPQEALPPMPEADRHFLEPVLALEQPPYQASFQFDEALRLRAILEFSPPC